MLSRLQVIPSEQQEGAPTSLPRSQPPLVDSLHVKDIPLLYTYVPALSRFLPGTLDKVLGIQRMY